MRELNSIKMLCKFAADCHTDHVHVNREMLEKVLEKLDIAEKALEIAKQTLIKITVMCEHDEPYNGELCECSTSMKIRAQETLLKLRGGKE